MMIYTRISISSSIRKYGSVLMTTTTTYTVGVRKRQKRSLVQVLQRYPLWLQQLSYTRHYLSTISSSSGSTTTTTVPESMNNNNNNSEQQQQQRRTSKEEGEERNQNEIRKQCIACKIYMNAGGHESHVEVIQNMIIRAQTIFRDTAIAATVAEQQQQQQQQVQQTQVQSVDESIETTKTGTVDVELMSPDSIHDDTIHTISDQNDNKNNEKTNDNNTNIQLLEYTQIGALVNVHFDPDSNRCSFHIAGPVMDVIHVTKELVTIAIKEFRIRVRGCKMPPNATQRKFTHKLIDIVDHICFVPLVPYQESKIMDRKRIFSPLWVPTYSAYAARQIGEYIRSTLDIQIFYYDFAQRNNVSYIEIMNRRVKYFSTVNLFPESAFIGACMDYVEDVHILLSVQCGKYRMKELIKLLNSNNTIDTGLSDVHATAQLYDKYRWDIHCRLLRPHLTGSNMAAIEQFVQRWNILQKGRCSSSSSSTSDEMDREFVVKVYRVGPSYNECIQTLQTICISNTNRTIHDEQVQQIFENQVVANYRNTNTNNDNNSSSVTASNNNNNYYHNEFQKYDPRDEHEICDE